MKTWREKFSFVCCLFQYYMCTNTLEVWDILLLHTTPCNSFQGAVAQYGANQTHGTNGFTSTPKDTCVRETRSYFNKFNENLFVFTVFRNINVPGLNDSYYVGLSIYNTVICCVVAVPLSFLAVSSIGVTFALVSGFLLLCITASLCLLFFPKVRCRTNLRKT